MTAKGNKGPSPLKDILYLDDAETMPIMPVLNMKVGNQSVTQRDHTAYIACVGIEQQRTYVPKRGTSSKKSRQYFCINSKEAKDDKEKESVKRAGKKRKRDDDTSTAGAAASILTSSDGSSILLGAVSVGGITTNSGEDLDAGNGLTDSVNIPLTNTENDGTVPGCSAFASNTANTEDDQTTTASTTSQISLSFADNSDISESTGFQDDIIVYCNGAIKMNYTTKHDTWAISALTEHCNCVGGTAYLSANSIAKQLTGE